MSSTGKQLKETDAWLSIWNHFATLNWWKSYTWRSSFRKGNRLRIAAALSVTGFWSLSASATVVITDDAGGSLGAYLERYSSMRDSGERVIVDGSCLSACTLVLALIPPERICLTQNAVFGFHAAISREEQRYPTAAGAATQALWALYPAPIRNLIAKKGGLSDKVIYLTAQELSSSVRQCAAPR